jgi:hypothetical protein
MCYNILVRKRKEENQMKNLQSHFPTCLIEKWIREGYDIKHIFGKIYYFKTEKRFIFGDKKPKKK